MIYITGDMHGDISQMRQVMQKINCKPNNTLIVLGDFGANYYFDKKDDIFKNAISEYNINIFVIRGNHDGNPSLIEGVEQKEKYDNIGYIEQKYPNIFYAINGNIYNIEKNQFLVLGGAYSVDKFYRLSMGYKWFSDEQMTISERENFLQNCPKEVDVIITHTCPYTNIPKHLFLKTIDQSTVDNSMEYFLQEVKEKVNYKNWFFGHYHANEQIEENMYMLYDGIIKYKPVGKLKVY